MFVAGWLPLHFIDMDKLCDSRLVLANTTVFAQGQGKFALQVPVWNVPLIWWL